MKFVTGPELTCEMKKLMRESELKIAVSYWGNQALKIFKLNPKRQSLKIICCLSGGKSAPKVIEQFGERARQNDKLHAKVLWSPRRAIVGSANASSNGLPEEESLATGLLEAGVVISQPSILKTISDWFDREYASARPISKRDLKLAADARARRVHRFGPTPPEIVELPLSELREAKVSVLVWAVEADREADAQTEQMKEASHKNISWYHDSLSHARRYPSESFALTYRMRERSQRLEFSSIQEFKQQKSWPKLQINSPYNRVIWTFETKRIPGLRYKIGRHSHDVIKDLLHQRGVRLKNDLRAKDPNLGFTTWEPLADLLATRKP